MATKDSESTKHDSQQTQTLLQDHTPDTAQNTSPTEDMPPPTNNKNDASRAIYIYTRPQLLAILQSPLVKPPADMPNLMQWLGSGDSGSADNKKDADASAQTTSRDRRFRRDNDDNDAPLRPPFRSSLTQPSQMGNFKHQSMRTTERERDRDRESDKDKEGHERLRNLSDKFDRERLSHPSNGIRSKDSAPHLSANSARIGAKKKAGENSEDWRRGAEPPRPGRDDKPEDRERARSRTRDTSKARRETSPTRKDRDRDDGERDRYRRVDKERDDYRKEREAYRRDRDDEQDDPRKWRDDGRRDERLAQARRERERDPNWDDRRWTLVEERDSRSKRSSGREKRQQDEPKDREEKKDREREKDKEPAWMDSTALLTPGSGIIGGQPADGGLDQIQAWKKSLKEREQREKDKSSENTTPQAEAESTEPTVAAPDAPKHLDEIQLFKLIMKREGEKKSSDSPSDSPSLPTIAHPATESSGTATKGTADPRDLLSMLSGVSVSGNSPLTPSESASTLPPSATRTAESSAQSTPQIPQFQPPPGSRVLAMRNPSSQAVLPTTKPAGGYSPSIGGVPTSHSPVQAMMSPGLQGHTLSRQSSQKGDLNIIRQNFSPFDEQQSRAAFPFDSPQQQQQILHDSLRRQQSVSHAPDNVDMLALEHGNFENRNGGSRFAKFFDNKPREMMNGGVKGQNAGFTGNMPPPHPRHEPGSSPAIGGDQRTMEDLYAMLQSSTQNRLPSNAPMRHVNNASLQLLQQQQLQQQQLLHQQQSNANRLEALYDSRLDDRSFVPDGMVPGLRTAPPPRRRPDGIDIIDESLHFNNRHPNVQQRGLDQMYNGLGPYGQQLNGGRNVAMSLQQQQFRGGSSPINHNALHNPQQRMPPGLANLGGRPPHEPAQLAAMQGGLPGNGIQQFNNFSPNGGGLNGFGNSPNLRGHINPQQLDALSQLGHLGNVGQQQGLPGGLRGGAGFNNPSIQQGGQNMYNLRQQQQSMLPPHMHPQHVPQAQHQPPPQGFHNPNNQGAHDLMALLMGGQLPRE